jgi:hypothetical protein
MFGLSCLYGTKDGKDIGCTLTPDGIFQCTCNTGVFETYWVNQTKTSSIDLREYPDRFSLAATPCS